VKEARVKSQINTNNEEQWQKETPSNGVTHCDAKDALVCRGLDQWDKLGSKVFLHHVQCMIDDFQLRVHNLTFHFCSTDSLLSLTLAKGSPSFTILTHVVFHSKVYLFISELNRSGVLRMGY
jgi:hypothetical protein